MSYAFEQIKHNKVLIKQTTPSDLAITGFFIDLPDTQISQDWGDDERYLNKTAVSIYNFSRTAGSLLKGGTKTVQDRYNKSQGSVLDKIWSIFTNFTGFLTDFAQNIGQETGLRYIAATSQEWKGPQVPTITMDFIIMENKGDSPISKTTLNKIKKLIGLCAPSYSNVGAKLEQVTELGLRFDSWRGPAGFNGAKLGTSGVSNILTGVQEGLITLQLKTNEKTRLLLRNFLVISSISMSGSEQFYTTNDSHPGYKWIKLSISFQGACALPATPMVQNGPSVQSLLGSELDEFDQIESQTQNSGTPSRLGGV